MLLLCSSVAMLLCGERCNKAGRTAIQLGVGFTLAVLSLVGVFLNARYYIRMRRIERRVFVHVCVDTPVLIILLLV